MVLTRSQSDRDSNGAKETQPQTKQQSQDTTLTPGERKTLRVVFISLVIDLLAFTVILPLLPSLLDYYGSKEVIIARLIPQIQLNFVKANFMKTYNSLRRS